MVTEDYGANTTADPRDRVFQFDAIGNRQKTASGTLELPETPNYSANALNQYTLAGGVTLPTSPAPAPHDEDGNYSRGPIPVASGNATLNWDAENRLVKITRADSVVITYAYDFQGRRISKTVDEGTSRHFFYEGWNPIAEFSGTTLEKTYLWGMDLSGFIQGAGGVGGLLAVKEGANHYYPTFDGNGNVSEYLNSSGVPVAHYEYDAFGRNATVPTGTKANDFAHRFSTKFFDSESGFYYYGYRFYDPVTGRWPSRDPIEERGGINLYEAVGNNLTGRFDINGLTAADAGEAPWFEIKFESVRPRLLSINKSGNIPDGKLGWIGNAAAGGQDYLGKTEVSSDVEVKMLQGATCCIDNIEITQSQTVLTPVVGTKFYGTKSLGYEIGTDERGYIFDHEYMGHAVPNNILAAAVWKSVRKCRLKDLGNGGKPCNDKVADIRTKIKKAWSDAQDRLSDNFHKNVDASGHDGELNVSKYSTYLERVRKEATRLEATDFCAP